MSTTNITPLPRRNVAPIIIRSKDVFILLHSVIILYPKIHRYSLATKIDNYYLNYLSYIFYASIEANEHKKYEQLVKANNSLDLVKLLLEASLSINCIKENKYFEISEKLNELGKIIGGWKRNIESKSDSK